MKYRWQKGIKTDSRDTHKTNINGHHQSRGDQSSGPRPSSPRWHGGGNRIIHALLFHSISPTLFLSERKGISFFFFFFRQILALQKELIYVEKKLGNSCSAGGEQITNQPIKQANIIKNIYQSELFMYFTGQADWQTSLVSTLQQRATVPGANQAKCNTH